MNASAPSSPRWTSRSGRPSRRLSLALGGGLDAAGGRLPGL